MGFEPTTGFPASDFETGSNPRFSSGKAGVLGTVVAELAAGEAESVPGHPRSGSADPDLALILDRWPTLPESARADIMAIVKGGTEE